MEKLVVKKRWTAIFFLLLLFGFSIWNMKQGLPELTKEVNEMEEEAPPSVKIAQMEEAISENVAGRYDWMDVYGYLQRLLGKKEESGFEVVKDQEGKLHYTYFATKPQDTAVLAARVKALAEAVEAESPQTKLVFVLPPDKYLEGHTEFAPGLPYHMANEAADQFLEQLDDLAIESLDLRENLKESRLELSEAFPITDHHWRIETAFWAAGEFTDWLTSAFGETLDPEGYYADLDNYNCITYENIALGSMGRQCGRYYAGTDDFTLIYPKFATSYRYENTIEQGTVFQGRFEEALLAVPVIRQSVDPFDTDMYATYLYGDPVSAHIVNEKEQEGLEVCLIKDSFAAPFAAFFSLRCHTTDMIDARYVTESDREKLIAGEYDYIVIMVSPQNLTEEFFLAQE